jgi:NAD dependent epimerase/dehydratase family enzyme
MKSKRIVIAGGTGFIGQALARYFGKDNHVVILSRKTVNGHNNGYSNKLLKASDGYNITYWRWDGRNVEKHWMNEIEGCDMVINLAGKSVNCRYNERNKQEILNSRIQATHTLGEAIRKATVPPKCWINAASATIYRHATDRAQDEETGEISEWRKDNMPYSFLDRLRFRCKRTKARLRYGKIQNSIRHWTKTFRYLSASIGSRASLKNGPPLPVRWL